MKFSVVFLLVLDISLLKGQQQTEEPEHILLKFTFPSFYNSYNKSCCKLYPGGCYKLLDSTGYTCALLKGRVTKTEEDGWIEFRIANVQVVDGGFYRCLVLGTQNHIYRDYYVEVSETSVHHSQSEPPLTTIINTPNTLTTIADSTGPALAQDNSDSPRFSWSFCLPLAVIVSITVMVLITSVIGVVCFKVNANSKSSDNSEETACESLKQAPENTSGIVYTTVDFRAQQKATGLYANLRMHKAQAGALDSTWEAEHAGMVEYSTLAIYQ